jgi:hypothetical protein
MRLATVLLALTFSTHSAVANDLGFARWYHLVADICINEMIPNKDATANLLQAGRSLIAYCDCVSLIAGGKFSKEEQSSVIRGEIPASARTMWVHWHQTCAAM